VDERLAAETTAETDAPAAAAEEGPARTRATAESRAAARLEALEARLGISGAGAGCATPPPAGGDPGPARVPGPAGGGAEASLPPTVAAEDRGGASDDGAVDLEELSAGLEALGLGGLSDDAGDPPTEGADGAAGAEAFGAEGFSAEDDFSGLEQFLDSLGGEEESEGLETRF
jgi:hypothetical protein